LTHDYLVPTLRQWLTRKQRETRQGRMELLLDERVSLYGVKQDSRQLPGWWEWLNILLWTRSRNRTPPQRRMLRAATRRHLLQAAGLVLAGALFGWGLWEVYRGPVTVDHLVRQLASADIADINRVDQIIGELAACRRSWADPDQKLRALVAAESSSEKERLLASLALLPDPRQVDYLEKQLLEVGPDEALVIVRRLRQTDHHRDVASWLRTRLEIEKSPDRRFRAACALAYLHPGSDWGRWSDEVAEGLIKEYPPSAQRWLLLLMGVRLSILRSLERVFLDPGRTESERSLAAALAMQRCYQGGEYRVEDLMNLILEVEGAPYEILNQYFVARGPEAAAVVHRELNRPSPADPGAVERLAKRQAHAAVALLPLEEWDSRRGPLDESEPIRADRIWLLLQDSPDDHRLHSLRSYLLHRFARVGVKPTVLDRHYAAERNASARRALLLSLGEFNDDRLPADVRKPLAERLWETYWEDPDPGIHSAADWLLRRWKYQGRVKQIDQELATGEVKGDRQWYVTARQGHTLAVIRNPAEFTMGSPKHEPGRRPGETPHRRHIPRSFAIATKEVTARQFREFLKANPGVSHDWGPTEKFAPDAESDDGPVIGVTWFAAAQYCRWLSEREGIPKEQECYPPEIKDGMQLPADYLARTGYRLPTEAEWEYACRAGAVTSRPHGGGDDLLDHYARHAGNSRGRAGRVGSLMPNDLGLFDMLGNAWEWCHDALAPYPRPAEDREQQGAVTAAGERVLRGGGFFSAAPDLRSAYRFGSPPQGSFSLAGFRVARTWR
jgi:formylglycine-generating enzyme required for sulfatase activity